MPRHALVLPAVVLLTSHLEDPIMPDNGGGFFDASLIEALTFSIVAVSFVATIALWSRRRWWTSRPAFKIVGPVSVGGDVAVVPGVSRTVAVVDLRFSRTIGLNQVRANLREADGTGTPAAIRIVEVTADGGTPFAGNAVDFGNVRKARGDRIRLSVTLHLRVAWSGLIRIEVNLESLSGGAREASLELGPLLTQGAQPPNR